MRRRPEDDAALRQRRHLQQQISRGDVWWRTARRVVAAHSDSDAAPSPSPSPSPGAERFLEICAEVRRHEQNEWLERRKMRRRFEFTAEQKRMLRQWFDALDADGSGKISVEELEDPMLSIGIVSDRNEIRKIVGHLDKDANGLIDFREFVDFLTPHARSGDGALGKHEEMFMLLTKKMEVRTGRNGGSISALSSGMRPQHQSSGFLEINTQLSMERRRFILDAITQRSTQALMNDMARLNVSASAKEAGGSDSQHQRLERALAKKKKAEAARAQQQVEMRFQALQEVLARNAEVAQSFRDKYAPSTGHLHGPTSADAR
ncbi:hypothetical protein ATCC90586_003670 [Pythium insidiosum]|nr:hypothetical protein ATCC90586_003670 [Pythium insidiosum]